MSHSEPFGILMPFGTCEAMSVREVNFDTLDQRYLNRARTFELDGSTKEVLIALRYCEDSYCFRSLMHKSVRGIFHAMIGLWNGSESDLPLCKQTIAS